MTAIVRLLSPPDDPSGSLYRDAYLCHLSFMLAVPSLWHLIAYLADDAPTFDRVAQAYSVTTLPILCLRVFLHEAIDAQSAPVYAMFVFVAWISYAYVASTWNMLQHGGTALLVHRLVELITGTQVALDHVGLHDGSNVASAGAKSVVSTGAQLEVAEAALYALDARCWAYLLELPNAILMGWGFVGLRFLGGLPRAPYALFSGLFMLGIAVNTYRESTPTGFKRSFHTHLLRWQLLAYIGALWLCFILGIWLGAQSLSRGPHSQGQDASEGTPTPGESHTLVADATTSVTQEASFIPSLECPITCETFVEPVLASDGHTYESSAIQAWLAEHSTSPLTGEAMPKGELRPNWIVKGLVEQARRGVDRGR